MDVAATAGTPAKLNADYFGYGSGGDAPVDNDKTIRIEAKVLCQGNFRVQNCSDCYYQKIVILATWINTDNQTRTDKAIGQVWFAHFHQLGLHSRHPNHQIATM